MESINTLFLAYWGFTVSFGLFLLVYFVIDWQIVKNRYLKNEGKILLFLTLFSCCGLLVLISEFTNIINFII